jgi:hypothetical protein
MKFLDIFSIVAGVASILSLVLMLQDRFAVWRKYVLPISYALCGFAAGRISAIFSEPSTSKLVENSSPAILILSIAVLTIITLVTFAFLKRNETWIAWMVLYLGLSFAAPQVMKSFSETSSHLPPGDLILLATEKERVSDLSGAITYLEKASETSKDKNLQEQLQARIKKLQLRLADSVSKPPEAKTLSQ